MIKPPQPFQVELNGVKMTVQELDIPKFAAFRVVFSSSRLPIVVARSRDADKNVFWTSIPECRQKEAEGLGKLIEKYLKKRNA